MSEVVCQVSNQAGAVEFIWSSRGGFFRPYVVSGTELTELRQAADQTREALEKLVFTLNDADVGTPPWEPAYELAEAGFRLHNYLLPSEDETAHKVHRWLEDLRKQSGLIGLEVVVEERSDNAGTFLSVPWNLVYDERPAKSKAAFQKGQGVERWRPFWSVRYNLTSGRRVEPLKRLPLWSDPRVVVVVDPTVHEGLDDDQKGRLDGFLAEAGLTAVGSLDELEAALEEGYPRLLYWLGHGTPEYLMLGDERIAPGDLRNLLRSFDDRERPEGMLAFLNACQTAEAGSGGSFLDVLHSFGFTGAIATERQTIDTFANEFGLAFLQGFLREGKPLGELLHGLRLNSAPLALLYGAHCPPEIRVRSGNGAADVPAPLPIRESGPVSGISLGEAAPRGRRRDRRAPQTPAAPPPAVMPPLPEQPYRSLAFYDETDRALFTGRDADVVRFAATLDRPDTRLLILHGESGTGKSSFLRAGVIPYLEQECVGYRFFRRGDGSVLIVQAAKDLVGQLAQALLDATETALRYDTPAGEAHTVNLRRVLDEALGTPADYATLREALRRDPHLLADVLARMADRLPHALVLVLDQAEEVFTLARTAEEVVGRDHGLRMLQRLVDVTADVKLIVSLRTEYYGRLLDYLRAGRRDLTGVRDDLLRDFSRAALIEAITRPTSETPLAPGRPSPRETYGFHFAEGIPGQIADGVLALRSENQDSVLPLVQVICTQLYEREKSLPGMDGIITREDLDAIKGVEGGLKAFAEDALVRSLRLGPVDREAFKALFSQLYNRQPDGTLTTWLIPRASLENQWNRPTPFADLLEAAKSVRLLREDELRIEGGEPRRYVRLGHDALAKVAAAWQAEREENQRLKQERNKRRKQFRRLLIGAAALLVVTLAGGYILYDTRLRAAQRLTQANGRVDALETAEIREVPGIIQQLQPDRRLVLDRLRTLTQADPAGPSRQRRRLHAALALLPDDPTQLKPLAERLLQADAQPDEVVVIRQALQDHDHAAALTPRLWAVLEKTGTELTDPQLRAAGALALFDPMNTHWPALGPPVAAKLVGENPLLIGAWREAFQPVSSPLAEPLRAIYGHRDRPEERALAYTLLLKFATQSGNPSRPEDLAELVAEADPAQFRQVLELLRADRARAIAHLASKLEKPARFDDMLARRQGRVATALVALGEAERAWPLMKHRDDPSVRTELIHDLSRFGVDPGVVIARLKSEPEVSARRALILALGEFPADRIPASERESVAMLLRRWYHDDPDPGVHGGIDWLLRQRWNQVQELDRIDKELAGPNLPKDRDWYVNGQGQTFAVIRGPVEFRMGSTPESDAERETDEVQHRRRIDRSFAIATKEVTVAQYARFLNENPGVVNFLEHPQFKLNIPSPDCAMGVVLWYDAASYCNWLSRQEGIAEDQWCYPKAIGPDMKIPPDWLERVGYRLPTEAEWEYTCRAGAASARPYGGSEDLLPEFGWFLSNAKRQMHPAGQKKPNDRGLFDVLGNAYEWSHDAYEPYRTSPDGKPILDAGVDAEFSENFSRVLRGGAYIYSASFLRSANRVWLRPAMYRNFENGFRLARTYP
jgi:formylglycine-generating enzyme required for sulfatase activity